MLSRVARAPSPAAFDLALALAFDLALALAFDLALARPDLT